MIRVMRLSWGGTNLARQPRHFMRENRMSARLALMLVCLVITSPGGAQAAVYRFESIVLPGEGPSAGYGPGFGFTAINDLGEIAGTYFSEISDYEGFLRGPDGSTSPLMSFANDINNAGAIVGRTVRNDRSVGFLADTSSSHRDEITLIELRSESGVILDTVAMGINDLGQIVGSVDRHFSTSGFLRDSDGGISIFRGPGSAYLVPTGINNHGQITGYVHTSGGDRGFVRDADGSFEIFRVAGIDNVVGIGEFEEDSRTYPQAINDSGQIVGYFLGTISEVETRAYRGFIRDSTGQITYLDVPAGTFGTLPLDINNSGEIVGNYFHDSEGWFTTAFIATPVPIPGGLGLFCSGIIVCCTIRRRRPQWSMDRR